MSVRLSHSRVLLWNTPTNTRIHKRSQSSWSEIGVRADLVMLHSTHTFNQTPTPFCPHGRAQGGEVLLLFSSPRFKCLTLNISDSGSAAWERKDERNRGEGGFTHKARVFLNQTARVAFTAVCVCVWGFNVTDALLKYNHMILFQKVHISCSHANITLLGAAATHTVSKACC